MNHAQWWAHAGKGEVKRATWVCGEVRVLVEEVVDTIRRLLAASDLDYLTLTGGVTPDTDIWAAANQYPFTPGNRLILIRDAARITQWAPLHDWLTRTRQLAGVHLLFVAAEHDLPTLAGKRALAPHVEALKAPRGHLVRCAPPAGPDAVAWVRRRSRLDTTTARHLLTRTGGNLARAAGVCAKLNLFDGQPTAAVIDALAAEAPAESFVERLLHRDKRGALSAIDAMAPDDYGRAIATLDHRLDLMAVLWQALKVGQSTRNVTGQPVFLVAQFMPAAKHYDPARCAYSRRVLAVLDDAYRTGARTGLLEALVALW